MSSETELVRQLLQKLQDMEPWAEWFQPSFCPRAIQSRNGQVIVYTLGSWWYNNGRNQHVFASPDNVYSFIERASVIGQLRAL